MNNFDLSLSVDCEFSLNILCGLAKSDVGVEIAIQLCFLPTC